LSFFLKVSGHKRLSTTERYLELAQITDPGKKQTLIELFKKHNEDVKSLIGKTKSKGTYQKYEVTLKHVTNFIRKDIIFPIFHC